MNEPAAGNGTTSDPWVLRTPPSESESLASSDTTADPSTLVCIVGRTTLGDHQRCVEDLRGRFANSVPAMVEHLGLAELEHDPRNNRLRAH